LYWPLSVHCNLVVDLYAGFEQVEAAQLKARIAAAMTNLNKVTEELAEQRLIADEFKSSSDQTETELATKEKKRAESQEMLTCRTDQHETNKPQIESMRVIKSTFVERSTGAKRNCIAAEASNESLTIDIQNLTQKSEETRQGIQNSTDSIEATKQEMKRGMLNTKAAVYTRVLDTSSAGVTL
jgi:chromosome segregation ATPase